MKRILLTLLSCLALFYSCDNSVNKLTLKDIPYQDYLLLSDSIVSQFDSVSIEKRKVFLSNVFHTEYYKHTGINRECDTKSLNVLNTICSGIIASTPQGYSVLESEEMALSKDEMMFTRFATALCLPINGGVTKEIIDIFERHKQKFGFMGKAGTIYFDVNGRATDSLVSDFDISPFFIMLDNRDKKALDAVFEAHLLGIRNWEDKKVTKDSFFMPYLSFREEYQGYLKQFYQDSKYYLDFDFKGTSPSLVAEYESNEIAADKKYKNKGILLTGTILKVSKDLTGNNTIILRGSNIMSNVRCIVSESDAMMVKSGQNIELVGYIKGIFAGSVILDDCKFY